MNFKFTEKIFIIPNLILSGIDEIFRPALNISNKFYYDKIKHGLSFQPMMVYLVNN